MARSFPCLRRAPQRGTFLPAVLLLRFSSHRQSLSRFAINIPLSAAHATLILMADEPAAAAVPKQDEGDTEEERRAVISRVVERGEANPNPRLLHTLATTCEDQEVRHFHGCASNPTFNNANSMSSHAIGKLANLLRENDEFFDRSGIGSDGRLQSPYYKF